MAKYFFLVVFILFILLANPFLARADFNIIVLPPTVTISANPTTVTYPASSMITWNSQNASSCWGSSAWAGTMAPSGSVSVSPMQTTIYTINCINANGQQSDASAVVIVNQTRPYTVLPPTVTISANPTTVTYPASSMITWNSQNASSCWGSSAWAGTMAPSGSVSVNLSQTATYTVYCTNIHGQQSDASAVVIVNQSQPVINPNPNPQILPSVTVNLNLTPATAASGASVLLVWSSANASSCNASGGWSGNKSLSGSEVVTPTANSTYTLTCYNPQGYSSSDSKTFSVSNTAVVPLQQTFTAACAPSVSSAQTSQSVLFAAADSGSSGSVTYSWSGDVSGSGRTRVASFSAPGLKTATVTAADSTGRTARASCSISINPRAIAAATVSNFTRSVVNLRPVATTLAAGKCDLNQCLNDKDLNETNPILDDFDFGRRLLAALFIGENGDISWLAYIFAVLFIIMFAIIVFLIRKLNKQRRLQVSL